LVGTFDLCAFDIPMKSYIDGVLFSSLLRLDEIELYESKSRIDLSTEPRACTKVTVLCNAYASIMFSVCDLMFREFWSMLKMKER